MRNFGQYSGWQRKHFINYQSGSKICWKRKLIYFRAWIDTNEWFMCFRCILTSNPSFYLIFNSARNLSFHCYTMFALSCLAFLKLPFWWNVVVISFRIDCDVARKSDFFIIFSPSKRHCLCIVVKTVVRSTFFYLVGMYLVVVVI